MFPPDDGVVDADDDAGGESLVRPAGVLSSPGGPELNRL